MPKMNVASGTMPNPADPEGEQVPIKIIQAESVDGIIVQLVIPEASAPALANAIDPNRGGGGIVPIASMPSNLPPEPGTAEAKAEEGV